MKFSLAALCAVFGASAVHGFVPLIPSTAFLFTNSPTFSMPRSMSSLRLGASVQRPDVTKKDKRREYMAKDSYFKNGFKEVREEVADNMDAEYKSSVVDQLKESNFVLERGDVKVHLAKDFGFCWGVERSIALAYEAREHFPDRQLHITNELIHNPEVNDKLEAMEVEFVPKTGGEDNGKDFSNVGDGDVVILPAFGATIEEMQLLDSKNVEVVDTTCPWVSKVWNTVDLHQRKGLTSIIHGKYAHEETMATTSFCEDFVCVKDMGEAEYVAEYIVKGGDKEEFMEKFKHATSASFNPDTMLSKIGLANQTTMYKKETRAIGQLLQKAMLAKFGPVNPKEHYLEFDTICDATQERQDAIHELITKKDELGLDFILVIGGWDSSNTQHLLEIPIDAGVTAYHINRGECISADNTITHRKLNGDVVTEPFLPAGKVNMGVTSGASTPDRAVQDSLDQIFLLKKVMA